MPYINETGKIITMRGEKGFIELDAVSKDLKSLGIGINMIDEFKLR